MKEKTNNPFLDEMFEASSDPLGDRDHKEIITIEAAIHAMKHGHIVQGWCPSCVDENEPDKWVDIDNQEPITFLFRIEKFRR